MEKRENDSQPREVTFEEAQAYVQWLSQKHGVVYTLPTLEQLKAAQSTNQIVMFGKEWTKEGWVYNPILKTVVKKPTSTLKASFRVVKHSS